MKKKKLQFPIKETGIRFKLVRESLEKSREELAGELKISRSAIYSIERGSTKPNMFYLYQLYKKYDVDLNWLLFGAGEMFVKEKETGSPGKRLKIPAKKKDAGLNSRYEEFDKLMNIPVIEQVIFSKLRELKAFYKEEIDKFFKGQDLKDRKEKRIEE